MELTFGFTGTRRGLTPQQVEGVAEVLKNFRPTEFHHGDCVGADHSAALLADALDINTVAHPPARTALRARHHSTMVMRPQPYLERNRAIVNACDVLVACPFGTEEIKRGSGTWATIRYAEKIGRELLIIWPDGERFWRAGEHGFMAMYEYEGERK